MKFNDRLKELRQSRKLTQEEFAQLTGLSRSAIGMYESGKREPNYETLEMLADFFNVDLNYLLGKSDANTRIQFPAQHVPVYEIKILGKVVAGVPMEAIEDITGTIRITNPDAANGHYYGLRVEGQSMEPEMHEGDLLIIHEQSYFDSGDICIVYIDGHDATVKKVQKSKDGLTLIGYNTVVYPPRFYSASEVESLPVRVVGKVVEVRRKY